MVNTWNYLGIEGIIENGFSFPGLLYDSRRTLSYYQLILPYSKLGEFSHGSVGLEGNYDVLTLGYPP